MVDLLPGIPLNFRLLILFSQAFCIILIVWVIFFVPETRGVRIEDMDKIFGGSDGAEDVRRMAEIRQQLGLDAFTDDVAVLESKDAKAQHIE